MDLRRDEENSLIRVDATDDELDMLVDKLVLYFERLPHHDEFIGYGQSETKLRALFRRALLSSRPPQAAYHSMVDLYSDYEVRGLLMALAWMSYYKKVTIHVALDSDGGELCIDFTEKPSAYFGVPDSVINAITSGRDDLTFMVIERKETDARSFKVNAKRSECARLTEIIGDKIKEEFV